MSKFSFSSCLGWIFMCSFAMIIANFVQTKIHLSREATIISYVALYFIFLYFVSTMDSLIYTTVLKNKRYKLAKFIILLNFIFDIECNLKKWEILSALQTNKFEKVQNYFNDKNYFVSFFALSVYVYNFDKKVVLNWFEEKYLNINLQLPTGYENIYRYIIKNIDN